MIYIFPTNAASTGYRLAHLHSHPKSVLSRCLKKNAVSHSTMKPRPKSTPESQSWHDARETYLTITQTQIVSRAIIGIITVILPVVSFCNRAGYWISSSSFQLLSWKLPSTTLSQSCTEWLLFFSIHHIKTVWLAIFWCPVFPSAY